MDGWGFREGDEIVPGRHAVLRLGGGFRNEAYVVWDDHLAALAVVKILRPELVEDERALRGLLTEAEALGRLAHPMLLRAFDARLDGERPHLLLELIDGPRLSMLLRSYRVAIEQTLPLALNLCSVLSYLERERTVHLDVKPSNIVMSATPKLIDLSVARRLDDLGEITGPVGTDAYMAPEQCDPARRHEIGPRSDMWGLGATLYEAATGRPPFPRVGEAGERFPQLRMEAPALHPAGIPKPLASVIRACLQHRPADRPTASEVAAELEPVVDSLPRPRIGPFRPGGRRLMRELELR